MAEVTDSTESGAREFSAKENVLGRPVLFEVRSRFVRLDAPRRISIVERELRLEPDQVLVKVNKSYICGSELHYYRGHYPEHVSLPKFLGHEGAGTIEKVGSKVSGYSVGDRVIVYADVLITPSGADPLFSDYSRAPSRCLQRIPDNIDFVTGALAEPLSAAVQAIYTAQPKLGDVCIVVGLGFQGIVILQGIKKSGARIVVGVDTVDSKLTLAKSFGADLTINATTENAVAKVLELTDGKGADLVIEAVGRVETVNQASAMLRKGGTLAMFGWVTRPALINLSDWHTKNLVPLVLKIPDYTGKMPWAEKGFELVRHGIIQVTPLITDEFRLGNISEAFVKYDTDPNVVKVAITP
jgi:L-iditol 2-dehydrogenase